MTSLRDCGADAIASRWNGSTPVRYRIDAEQVDRQLIGHPLLLAGASFSDEDGFVAVKRSAADLFDGPDPKVAHLSLFGGGCARALQASIGVLREDGYEALVVGTDIDHFLPGAPTDVPWMGDLLRNNGFVRGPLAFDLESDLRNLARVGTEDDRIFRRLDKSDLPALDAFLSREFPGRWRFDVLRKVEAEGARTIFGLFQGSFCEGFALLQEKSCRLPIGGAAWKADLGVRWASLGPIGVSARLRGHGLGRALLYRALEELRDGEAERAIIDWTSLIDYYGTQGFSVARAYRSYRLSLPAEPLPEA